ncbi:MAG: cytochrome c biogenesis protein ResB [Deltaproteobacteria bacterium]|nr:MAG: cytochrome c biogenesis protein ResB [Deltaproteobacteria bacterium]
MADDKRDTSTMDKVWNFFTSLKLAITVLIIMAVASIFGTIIEQNQPIEKYRQVYEDWAYHLLDRLNMFDMYHSWWFLLLLVLFTINLACCTLDRLPRVLKVVRNPKTTLDENLEKTLGQVDRWKKKGSLDAWADKYAEAMGKTIGKPRVTKNGDAVHLYAEKGVVSRFGVYVTHTSIIIIFIGAIVGNVLGFKGFVNILEGQSIRQVSTPRGDRSIDLDFAVRCNKFTLTYYTDEHGHQTQQPKEYASDLSVLENGREVLRKKIVVNDPLQYKGIWFYQSSYGQAGAASAKVAIREPGGALVTGLSLFAGQPVEIPGYGRITGTDYQPNYQGLGPALLVTLEKAGQPPSQLWLLESRPDFDRQRKDRYYLSFGGLSQAFYTGLQVAKDPGVNVVWVGCTLMVIGLLIAFFMSHQRLWVRLSPSADGRVDVVLAGSASKNRLAFEKKFEKIQSDMKAVAI